MPRCQYWAQPRPESWLLGEVQLREEQAAVNIERRADELTVSNGGAERTQIGHPGDNDGTPEAEPLGQATARQGRCVGFRPRIVTLTYEGSFRILRQMGLKALQNSVLSGI